MALHDRISGHANRVRVLDRFLTYARSKPGVWFARKDEIADWALKTRNITPYLDRGPVQKTGLSGPSAWSVVPARPVLPAGWLKDLTMHKPACTAGAAALRWSSASFDILSGPAPHAAVSG